MPRVYFFVLGLLVVAPTLSSGGESALVGEVVLQFVEAEYGTEARKRVREWGTLLEADKRLDSTFNTHKLERANSYFNQVRWLSDMEHWGQEDYWATPVETLATNGGDCEDFSIGKYFSLLEAAVDNEKLRITYVKSLTYDQAHMVLAYYSQPNAEPLILDNINKTILPASQRRDLVPVYSFSGDSIWLAKAREKKLNTTTGKSLPRWRTMNERFKAQLSNKGK